jgi:hypothetical protein
MQQAVEAPQVIGITTPACWHLLLLHMLLPGPPNAPVVSGKPNKTEIIASYN